MCRPLGFGKGVSEGTFFMLHVLVEIEGVGIFSFLKRFKFRPGAEESSSKELK